MPTVLQHTRKRNKEGKENRKLVSLKSRKSWREGGGRRKGRRKGEGKRKRRMGEIKEGRKEENFEAPEASKIR